MTIYAIGLVIDQTRKDGFRLRNVNETNHREPSRAESIAESGEKGSSEKMAIEAEDAKKA